MARKKRKRRGELEEIPVGSFSDIAFLLIVYFLVVTTLLKTQGFRMELPSGEPSQQQQEEDETPTVTLRDQQVIWNREDQIGTDKPFDELYKKLVELDLANKEGEEKIVMLEATGRVDYQSYYEAMATINRAGGIVGIIQEEQGE